MISEFGLRIADYVWGDRPVARICSEFGVNEAHA